MVMFMRIMVGLVWKKFILIIQLKEKEFNLVNDKNDDNDDDNYDDIRSSFRSCIKAI